MLSKRWIRDRLWSPFHYRLLKMVCHWPWLGNVYYCFNRSFQREHRAVLYGRMIHENHMRQLSDTGAQTTLRRNTHRLEKGLIMRPLRKIFARDYIEITVNLYARLCQQPLAIEADHLLCSWSGDVLRQYFEIIGSDPAVDRARQQFERTLPPSQDSTCAQRVPYRRDLSDLKVTYDDLLKLAQIRRSVRWYLEKPVPREMIDKAIALAAYSPSACNRQPFEFRVFDDPEWVQKVGAIPGGTAGFHQNFPCLVVLIGKLRAYPSERDRHVIYIDASLAAMSFQFALEVQGLSSCCINWPDLEISERKMAAALGLAPDERAIMCISLGYPDPEGMVPFSQKKSIDELRSYNQHAH